MLFFTQLGFFFFFYLNLLVMLVVEEKKFYEKWLNLCIKNTIKKDHCKFAFIMGSKQILKTFMKGQRLKIYYRHKRIRRDLIFNFQMKLNFVMSLQKQFLNQNPFLQFYFKSMGKLNLSLLHYNFKNLKFLLILRVLLLHIFLSNMHFQIQKLFLMFIILL